MKADARNFTARVHVLQAKESLERAYKALGDNHNIIAAADLRRAITLATEALVGLVRPSRI
jgi:hypothetical protein